MSATGCSMCNKKITRISDCVICDICRNNMHVTCAGLSTVEAECIRSTNRKINFFCTNCNIVTTINTLKNEIDNLKIELEALKDRSIDKPGASKTVSEEDIFQEAEERMQRSCNLILLNLPESNEKDANLRKNDDIHRCKGIITQQTSDINIGSCIRLGKYTENRVRPLKVVFENRMQAINCLQSYKLKERYYLNRDLTPRQQNHCFDIRKEFRERKGNGEQIQLRYKNGIPYIVASEHKFQKNL